MSGLVRYETMDRMQMGSEAYTILCQLAKFYIVEIEAPCNSISDWYVQIRRPNAPVVAGYYGISLYEAAGLVAASIRRSAAA